MAFRRAVHITLYDIDLNDRHIELMKDFKHLRGITYFDGTLDDDRIQRIRDVNPNITVTALANGELVTEPTYVGR